MSRSRIGMSLLAIVPFVGICFSVPLWDRVDPLVFGLPFNLFWLVAWIPLTSLCLWCLYRLRMRAARQDAASRRKETAR